MSTTPIPVPKTLTVFAPDGTQGNIPAENVQAAVAAGGKVGVHIFDPDGNEGFVPHDQLPAAIKAGATFVPKQALNANPGDPQGGVIDSAIRFGSGLLGAGKDAALGLYHAVQNSKDPGDMLNNLVVQPQVNAYKQGAQMLNQARDTGDVVQGVRGLGHVIASAVPMVGPAITGTADAMLPQIDKGNYAGALGTGVGNAALAYLGGKAAGALEGDSIVPGQNYNTSHAAAFEGLTAKANGMGPNFIPQNLTSDALSPIRQSAADMIANGNPTEQAVAQAATARGTSPLDRLGAVHTVIQKSLSDLEAQHAPVLQQVAQTPVDMTPIQKGLQAQIKPGMSSADIAGINDLIQRSGQITNLGDLNSFRQIMNEEASPSYRQTPTRAGQASAPQQVATDAANAVRNHYFDQMQQATGTDFQPLKAQESKLLTTKEAIERMQSPEAKAEATFNAPSTVKESLGNIANIIKEPRATVTQTILRESPATRAAMLIRKSLTNLPDPTTPTPQGTVIPPSNAPQLPANATPQTLTPQPPAPSPAPQPSLTGQYQSLLPNPQGQLSATNLRSLLETSSQPLELPASTNAPNVAQAPSTSYPALNEATARTRVNPTQFSNPEVIPPSGARPVTPSGQVMTPIQRFLNAGELDPSITNPSVDDLKRAIAGMRKKRGK